MWIFSGLKNVFKYWVGYNARFNQLKEHMNMEMDYIYYYKKRILVLRKYPLNNSMVHMCDIFDESFNNIESYYTHLKIILEWFSLELNEIKNNISSIPNVDPVYVYSQFNNRIDLFTSCFNQSYQVIKYWGSIIDNIINDIPEHKKQYTQDDDSSDIINLTKRMINKVKIDKDDFDRIIKIFV